MSVLIPQITQAKEHSVTRNIISFKEQKEKMQNWSDILYHEIYCTQQSTTLLLQEKEFHDGAWVLRVCFMTSCLAKRLELAS